MQVGGGRQAVHARQVDIDHRHVGPHPERGADDRVAPVHGGDDPEIRL